MSFGVILILTLTQGITEFLPISSSGHLVILPYFLEIPYQGKTFDVVLHFGSLFAVVFYLKKDIFNILKDLVSKDRFTSKGFYFLKCITLATLPVALIGYIINFYKFEFVKFIQVVGWTTLIFGILLGIADKIKINKKFLPRLKDSIIIGLMQGIAIIPGVSRSGIVITTSRFLGYDRVQSSKFSLFLSIPVIFAAMILKSIDIFQTEKITFSFNLGIGFILSLIFSFFTVKIFMRYIEKASLKVFVYYRIILGIIILYFVYFT